MVSTSTGSGWYIRLDDATGGVLFKIDDGNNDAYFTSNTAYNDGNWHMATLVVDASAGTLTGYVDANEVDSVSQSTGDMYDEMAVGAEPGNNEGNHENIANFNGSLDEFKIYNRSLSGSEVSTLYEENSLQSPDSTPPEVTVHSPGDGSTYGSSDVSLSVSVNESVSTWKYNLDGTGNTTFTPNTTLNDLSEGQHSVTVYATDSAGNTGSRSASFTVDLDTSGPETRNLGDNTSSGIFAQGNVVEFSAEFKDSGSGLSEAVLATNETGTWMNRTSGNQEIWSFTGHSNDVDGVAVDANGYVYSAGWDDTVRKINASTGNEVWSFTGHSSNVLDVAVDSDGYVYSASNDDTVRKISPSGSEVWSFTGHSNAVLGVAVDSSGYVYSASMDDTVRKIDSSGSEVWSFTGHSDNVNDVTVDSSGHVYSVSQDQHVKKIDSTGSEVWDYYSSIGGVFSVAVDGEGSVYAGIGDGIDEGVVLQKISSTGNPQWDFEGVNDRIQSLDVGPNGYVYSASEDQLVRKISSSGSEVWRFTGHTNPVRGVAVDSDGYVYSGAEDNTVRKIGLKVLFNGETGSWVEAGFDWSNSSFAGTLGYRIWGSDEAGNWARTSTGTVSTNSDPLIDSYSVSDAETGGTVTVDVSGSDPDGNLDTVYLNLTDADGNIEVLQGELTDEGGGSYIYSYSIGAEPSNLGDWGLNLRVVDSLDASTSNSSTFSVSDGTNPSNRDLQDNVSGTVQPGSSVNISTEFRDDDSGLSGAVLATNESGNYENLTDPGFRSYTGFEDGSLSPFQPGHGSPEVVSGDAINGTSSLEILATNDDESSFYDTGKVFSKGATVNFTYGYSGVAASGNRQGMLLRDTGENPGFNESLAVFAVNDNSYDALSDVVTFDSQGDPVDASNFSSYSASDGDAVFQVVFETSDSVSIIVYNESTGGVIDSVSGHEAGNVDYRYVHFYGNGGGPSGTWGFRVDDVTTYSQFFEDFTGKTGSFELADYIWQNPDFTGTLGYKVWGEDEAGNWGSTGTGSLTVNPPPSVDTVSTPGSAETGSSSSFSTTVSDDNSDIQDVYISLEDAGGNVEVDNISMTDDGGGSYSYSHSFSVEPSNVGDWTATIYVEDSAQSIDSQSQVFTVEDGTLPILRNLQDNTTSETGGGDPVNISVESRDDDSGLSKAVLATNETGTWENYSRVTASWKTVESWNYTFEGPSENESKYSVDLDAGTYRVIVHGADGGQGDCYYSNCGSGGTGGYINGIFTASSSDTLEIWVGEAGSQGGYGGWGRYNGGGTGNEAGAGGGSTEALLNSNFLAGAGAGGGGASAGFGFNVAGHGGAACGAGGTATGGQGTSDGQDAECGNYDFGGDGGDSYFPDSNFEEDSYFEDGDDGGQEAGEALTVLEEQTGGATKGANGSGYVKLERVEPLNPIYVEDFSSETGEWAVSDFTWQNPDFTGSLGYRVWTQDQAGNWNKSSTDSITFNLAPEFNEASLNWTGVGGSSSERSVSYSVSDPDGLEIGSRNSPPNGTVSVFTNSSYEITGVPGEFDYLASITDFTGASTGYETNYSTSETGFRAHSFNHELDRQQVNNTVTVENRGQNLSVDLSMTGPGTLVSGGNYSGTLQRDESVSLTGVFEHDFIAGENETQVQLGQNTSKTSTVDTQFIYNQTGLEVFNDRNYSFHDVNLSSRCSITETASVPSGSSQVTSECGNESVSGDWIKNEKNSSSEYFSGTPRFGEGLNKKYTASQELEVANVRTDFNLSVNVSSLLSQRDVCNPVNDTIQEVPKDSVQSYSIRKSCETGNETNWSPVFKTETSSFYKYEAKSTIQIFSNLTENRSIEYGIPKNRLDGWGRRDPTETEVSVDGNSNDVSVSEQVFDGTEYVVVAVGDQHGNSSLHEGTHNVSLVYYESKSPGSTSGGGGSGGGSGSGSLLPEGSETIVGNVSSDRFNWTVSAITTEDTQQFSIRGYPGDSFENYIVIRNTGNRNVTLDITCTSTGDTCDWVNTSVDRVVLDRNSFTEKTVKISGRVPDTFSESDSPARFGIRVADPRFNGSQSSDVGVEYVDFTVKYSPFLGQALDVAYKLFELREFESPVEWGNDLPYPFVFQPLFVAVVFGGGWRLLSWLNLIRELPNWRYGTSVAVFILAFILL